MISFVAQGGAVALSEDQTADREDERARIVAAGGCVQYRLDGWRLGAAGIQVSRCHCPPSHVLIQTFHFCMHTFSQPPCLDLSQVACAQMRSALCLWLGSRLCKDLGFSANGRHALQWACLSLL